MKLIHETDYVCLNNEFDGGAEKLFIYAFESADERDDIWAALDEGRRDEVLYDLGYVNQYGVPAGAMYSRYTIDTDGSFVIVNEYTAYNI